MKYINFNSQNSIEVYFIGKPLVVAVKIGKMMITNFTQPNSFENQSGNMRFDVFFYRVKLHVTSLRNSERNRFAFQE